jgi:hypothetical protein
MRYAILLLPCLLVGCGDSQPETADRCGVNDSMAMRIPPPQAEDSMPQLRRSEEAVPMPNVCTQPAARPHPPA